jgi:uncharacterized protein YkwD
VYQAPSASAADVETTRNTDIAVKTWYSGQQWYDYEAGAPRDTSDATKVFESNRFANVVWAATTKVGFGVKGKWVVAWYCDAKATPAETAASIQNIGVVCSRSGVNTCLNEAALAAHNEKRRYHATPPLEYDETIARDLQRQMDQLSDKDFKKWDGKIQLCEDGATCPYDATTGTATADEKAAIKAINERCMDNVYEEIDPEKLNELVTTSVATEAWYQGQAEFNYANGEPMAWNEEAQYKKYQDFTRMMWKKTAKVGFGIRGKYVIARYCDDNMSYTKDIADTAMYAWPFSPWPTRTATTGTNVFIGYAKIKANVGKICVKDGYNVCYNDAALKAHNDARASLEGYVPLKLDVEMAKFL